MLKQICVKRYTFGNSFLQYSKMWCQIFLAFVSSMMNLLSKWDFTYIFRRFHSGIKFCHGKLTFLSETLKLFGRYSKDSFLYVLSSSQTFGSIQLLCSKRGFSNDWNFSRIVSTNLLARSFFYLWALLRELSFRFLKFSNWIWIVSLFSKSCSMWPNFTELADKVRFPLLSSLNRNLLKWLSNI